jgi:CelD/BcsL family acetyltransferase involved in cellulose biosynthesis
VAALYRHFGNPRARLALLEEAGEVVAGALLEPKRRGVWQVFLPAQAPLGPAIFAPSGGGARLRDAIVELAGALPGVVWMLGFFNQDPDFTALASQNGNGVEIIEYATTVSIAVEGDFESYWGARPKQLRAKLRKVRRELEEAGIAHELAEIKSPADVAAAIAEHGRLESAGWKGQKGTAIQADNAQGRFYREVLESFAATDAARIYQLRFGGDVVASQLSIRQNGTQVLLKTAYDEARAEHSPGRLLDYLMLERAFAEKAARRIEYYTKASQEDFRWTTSSRPIYHVNHFRSNAVKKVVLAGRSLKRALRIR